MALKDLPETLEETYNRALMNVHKYHITEARYILQWVTFSYRPLTVEEVQETGQRL